MRDNRLPLLLDAAKKALVAIGDVGVYMRHANSDGCDDEAMRYLMIMMANDRSVDKQLEQAFGALQEALNQFNDDDLKA